MADFLNRIIDDMLCDNSLFRQILLIVYICYYSNLAGKYLASKSARYNTFIALCNVIMLCLSHWVKNGKFEDYFNLFNNYHTIIIKSIRGLMIILAILPFLSVLPIILKNIKENKYFIFELFIKNILPNMAGLCIFNTVLECYFNIDIEIIKKIISDWSGFIFEVLIPFAIMFSLIYSITYKIKYEEDDKWKRINIANTCFLFFVFFFSSILIFVRFIYFIHVGLDISLNELMEIYEKLMNTFLIFYAVYSFELLFKKDSELQILFFIMMVICMVNLLIFIMNATLIVNGKIESGKYHFTLCSSAFTILIYYTIKYYKKSETEKQYKVNCFLFEYIHCLSKYISNDEIDNDTISKRNKNLGVSFFISCLSGVVFILLYYKR